MNPEIKEKLEAAREEIAGIVDKHTACFREGSEIAPPRFAFMNALFAILKDYQSVDMSTSSRGSAPQDIVIRDLDLDGFTLHGLDDFAVANSLRQIPKLRFVNCSFSRSLFWRTDASKRRFTQLVFEDCSFGSFAVRDGKHASFFISFRQCKIDQLVFDTGTVEDSYQFESCTISSMRISEVSVLGDVSFVNSEFGLYKEIRKSGYKPDVEIDFKKVDFRALFDFGNSVFHQVPYFYACENLQNLVFDRIEISGLNKVTNEQMSSLRLLKGQAQSAHNDFNAMQFYSYELEARYNLYLKNAPFLSSLWFESIFSYTYRYFNSYGRDLYMPIIWWVYFWIMLGVVFWGCGSVSVHHEDLVPWLSNVSGSSVAMSLLYSFKMMIGPLGALLDTEGLEFSNLTSRIIGFFQQIFSTVALFLWVMQIRRRFKIT